MMLKILGMSNAENLLSSVNRFGKGLTVELRGTAALCRVPLEGFVRQSSIGAVLHF